MGEIPALQSVPFAKNAVSPRLNFLNARSPLGVNKKTAPGCFFVCNDDFNSAYFLECSITDNSMLSWLLQEIPHPFGPEQLSSDDNNSTCQDSFRLFTMPSLPYFSPILWMLK